MAGYCGKINDLGTIDIDVYCSMGLVGQFIKIEYDNYEVKRYFDDIIDIAVIGYILPRKCYSYI